MKKPTLTIGIPAYNEEKNIGRLLDSISKQAQTSYVLKNVIVACDGSTDETAKRAKSYKKFFPKLEVHEASQRKGKISALTYIYKETKTDLLLTLDADLVLLSKHTINKLVETLMAHKETLAVGPRHMPIKPKSMMGKFAYMSYVSFEDAFLRLNDGNNFYGLMSALLMHSSFAKSIQFPKGSYADQCYMWASATKNHPLGFRLVKQTCVAFRPVSTFADWRKLSIRSTAGDKDDVSKYFGGQAFKEKIRMPRKYLIMGLAKWFIKSPILSLGSVSMNLFVRLFPYKKEAPKDGIWNPTKTSKKAIQPTI